MAANAQKLAEKLKAELDKEKAETNKLKTEVSRIEKLEEKLEERTNRQLRKTLVFKGIPLKNRQETWQETEEVLREHIAEIYDVNYEDTDGIIERCHRSAPNKNYKGKNPQPIFAAIYDWKECEKLVDNFRKNNIADRSSQIQCEYKYGPMTTRRRNMALVERKRLKESGELVSGYVAYPAKLMVKKRGEKEYKLHMDFSRSKVEW